MYREPRGGVQRGVLTGDPRRNYFFLNFVFISFKTSFFDAHYSKPHFWYSVLVTHISTYPLLFWAKNLSASLACSSYFKIRSRFHDLVNILWEYLHFTL